jgi:hypothetical protein
MSTGARSLAVLALLFFASVGQAAFHNFRIEQIYTNADGSVQFVVLHEAFGGNGENMWSGRSLVATPTGGSARTFTFLADLPNTTANRRVLVATPGFAALNIVTPDFTMPAGFVPMGGGSLNYAGVHTVNFGPLPTDGVNAINVNGTPIPNVATNFAGQTGSVQPGPAVALAIEYYNQGLDHFFLTHIANEIAILDAGITIKGWTRTGQSFNVYAAAGASTSPVCRFYIPPDKGDSHFYGRGMTECNDTATKNPTFVNEDPQFFHVILPTLGVCPAGTVPVYRVFDNRLDANHRYMIDRAIRDMMVNDRHWLAEGDGPDLVVMCVPPVVSQAAPPDPMPPGMGDPPDPGYGGYNP